MVRDREMLVSNPKRGLKPLEPVRLKDCGPLKIIVPGRANVRRRNIEIYLETHGVEVAAIMEMDAMISTLQFVKRSDWVAILSGLICFADLGRTERIISPIYDPPLIAEFVVISPARRTLDPAQLFRNASRPRSRASGRLGVIIRLQSIQCGRGAPRKRPRPKRRAA
jgi:DNA-binding transcriptional LysR family regulator